MPNLAVHEKEIFHLGTARVWVVGYTLGIQGRPQSFRCTQGDGLLLGLAHMGEGVFSFSLHVVCSAHLPFGR